jgi:hypothetical protein
VTVARDVRPKPASGLLVVRSVLEAGEVQRWAVLIAGRPPWPVTRLHFGAADVYRRPEHVVATVRAALAAHRPS